MNPEWEFKKLGEVIKLEYGKPLNKSKRSLDGKYPVYGANGIKSRTNQFYHDKKSIIIGRKGSAGAISITEKKKAYFKLLLISKPKINVISA